MMFEHERIIENACGCRSDVVTGIKTFECHRCESVRFKDQRRIARKLARDIDARKENCE